MLPPSVLLPSPFARPPELGLQIVTCVKQHLIWSHRTRRRWPSVTRFWCFSRPRRSVFVKKKGACGRRAVALAVAIEVIKEGWNCRLWNRARSRPRGGSVGERKGRREGAENQNTELSIRAPESPDRPMEEKPRKKEVRTICLAERHQLVWPVLSGTG